MEWLLGLVLLVVLPIAAAGCASYRRDLAAARARVLSGSLVQTTRSGPMEYATLGEGSPVLVLHGASGGWDQGLACGRTLAARGFQVIAPSRFGYLRTPLPADPSPQAEADALADLLDALRITRLPVVAFSAGAASAVQLTLRHPLRVSHLVLMVPGAGGLCATRATTPPGFFLDALYRADFVMWLIMRLAPRFMYRLVGVPPSLIPSLGVDGRAQLDEVVESILPTAARRLGVVNEGRTQQPGSEYPLDQIIAPTLLISAADDLYQTLPVARHAATRIRHAALIEFATGGHLLLGHRDEVSSEVMTFLDQGGTEAGTRDDKTAA
jgi:2-hydroxy-6-oxonona-2,4-dienedioate hydrolase